MVVEAPSDMEAAFHYSEIFEAGAYLKHGLEIADGDCVFDLGANVGLFSASLAQRYRDLRLVLFEPVPDTFAMLERNAERLLGGARVTLVQAGVSSAPGKATFEFDPSSTAVAGASSFLRETDALRRSARREAGLVAWSRAAMDDGERAGTVPAETRRRLNAALGNPFLRPFTIAAIWAYSAVAGLKRRRRVQRIDCELTTVSAAMREHDIEQVDLMKIDVEGAEWAVLQGIEASDWPRIRQLALEVHDVEGRVERTRALLEDKGYTVVVEHNDWRTHELQGIRMLYARR
jgi:FkbM family methyltransferase